MGLIDFVKSAGQKLGLVAETPAPEATGPSPEQLAAMNKARAAALQGKVMAYKLEIEDLGVAVEGDVVTITGTTSSQETAEKAVLIVGNVEGIGAVDNQITVEIPEPPAVYHTVVKGDILSQIALDNYGILHMFDAVFEANKPMLESPDLIYPGQVLRIPPIEQPVHTVKSGDSLGAIAKHWFGDSRKYEAIFEANRHQLDNPNAIDVGQQLVIPVANPDLVKPAVEAA